MIHLSKLYDPETQNLVWTNLILAVVLLQLIVKDFVGLFRTGEQLKSQSLPHHQDKVTRESKELFEKI